MVRSSTFMLLGAGAALVATETHAASFRLWDHPAGNQSPPPYGLRLDGLFANKGGTGGVTTFSFDTYGDTILRVIDTGVGLRITIDGTVYGGEDTGAGVGYGAGDYAFSMVYELTVQSQSDGWNVFAVTGTNIGTLTALTGIMAGTTFNLFDKASGVGTTLEFLADDHRLDPNNPNHAAYFGLHVGRGWLGFDGAPTTGERDLLFVGEAIPLPLAGSMGLVALTGLAARRRR